MIILYIISTILLFTSIILFKKNDKKQSLLASVIITIGLFFCFNIFISYINHYLNIIDDLQALSIINAILSIILFIYIKKHGIQKYYFNSKELITTAIVFIITLTIGLIRFNNANNIIYESGDSSFHYLLSEKYSQVLKLLDDSNTNDLVYKSARYNLAGYYVNAGIFIKLLSFLPSYKAYIIFDILFFAYGSLLFYATMTKNENKFCIPLNICVVLLYSLAYMLNNLIFGFGYLGLGIVIVNLIMLLTTSIDYKNHKLFNVVVLFIINFALFFTYYLFVPILYLSQGLYYIYLYIKKKLNFIELTLYATIVLIIPFIIGMIYFVYPSFLGSNKGNLINTLRDIGYIYNGNILTFFLLVPLVIDMSRLLKSKKLVFENLCLFSTLFMMSGFLILIVTLKVNPYYYGKLLFILWLILFIVHLKLYDINKIKKYIYVLCIIILSSTLYNYLNSQKILNVASIYAYNFSRFKDENILLNKYDIELIDKSKEYYDICNTKDTFLISGSKYKNQWYYALTRHLPVANYRQGYIRDLQQDSKSVNTSFNYTDENCLIYFYENKKIDYYDNKVLYKNSSGAILKRK